MTFETQVLARLALLLPAMVFSFLLPSSARAQPGSRPDVEILSHGVKLALTLPASSYPEDALVRVTIRLENVSRKVVQIGSTSAAVCAQWGAGVQVGNDAGQILYPPATTWLLATCGPKILSQPLLPGHSVQRRLFATLRGNQIRAVAAIGRQSEEIRTPWLAVTLLSEPSPHVTVSTSPSSEIDVTPATPAQHGRFYYMDNIRCVVPIPDSQEQEGTGAESTRFQFKSPPEDGVYRFPSECEPPDRWSFVGGWLNHHAASVDYVKH